MFTGKRRIDMPFAVELMAITFLIMIGLIVPVANLAALALCAWMIFFQCGLDNIFDLLFYLLPLSPIFRLDLNGFAFFNLITIMVFLRLYIANGMALTFPSTAFFLIIVYILAGIRTAGKPDIIRFCCQMFTAAYVLSNDQFRTSLTAKRKNTMLSLGLISSSLIALSKGFFPRLAKHLGEGARIKLSAGSYYYRFMGVELNSNAFTILPSIILAVFALYMIDGKINKFDLALIALVGIFGAMSVSMSFILSVIAVFGIALLLMARNNPKVLFYTLIIGVVGLVAAVILFGESDVFQTILYRLQSSSSDSADMSSLTTGRSIIWELYFDYFMDHPLTTIFGIGLNAKLPYAPPHNYYIETVVYLGIAGSLIYIAAFFDLYSPSQYIGDKCRFYQHIPFLMLLIRGLARCLICEEKLMFIFMLYTLSAIDTYHPSIKDNPSTRLNPSAQ